MKKYGAVDVSLRDITRITFCAFVSDYSQGDRIHQVKEDFLGAEFVKQEDIGQKNAYTYRSFVETS